MESGLGNLARSHSLEPAGFSKNPVLRLKRLTVVRTLAFFDLLPCWLDQAARVSGLHEAAVAGPAIGTKGSSVGLDDPFGKR